MRSSRRTGLRTIIVAGFLVAAPLLAAFQGTLQDLIQRVLGNTSLKTAAATQSARGDAPAFRPLVSATRQPDDRSLDRSIGRGSAQEPADPFAGREGDFGSTGITDKPKRLKDLRESNTVQRPPFSTDAPRESDDGALANRWADQRAFDAVQTKYQERTSPPDRGESVRVEVDSRTRTPNRTRGGDGTSDRAADPIPAEVGGPVIASARRADPITHQYDRLRDLGATSSRLETWGPQGDRFRFQCRVATGDDPTEARHFEATDAQPLRAIEKVTAKIEDWRGERR